MKVIACLILHFELMNDLMVKLLMICYILIILQLKKKKRKWNDSYSRQVIRDVSVDRIIYFSDLACIENTRMDRCAFHALCNMLKRVGRLEPSRNMGVEEMVAMFLHIIAHDVKIRVIKRQFVRSEETISRRFNDVLLAILRCHNLLLKKPQPFSQDRMDERWKWFKDCLGALDGTHIKVNVLEADKPRYRNRKGDITTNVLGVVAPDMQFIYVLAGWEGSAADSRVLRDALFRNGFSVPQGHYYLCDAGYMNCEGFLAPYRGQKYHLSEFNPHNQPSTAQEFFNMKHSQARNVIERAFGVLKARWGILRGRSFYPIKTQGRIITACCLLHNHIRRVMVVDPIDEIEDQNILGVDGETIHHIETSDAWGRWRNQLAQEMWNQWRRRHHAR
ncbi:protein ALP1-like [Arachis duranensis]|uniref:Protein ALP1-like n=1 Tax=Arachis duranensis TaxID=130453 RepID=A0A6P4BBQ2_ARADU|nr:protein ALP1-like [Arachis duranensis]